MKHLVKPPAFYPPGLFVATVIVAAIMLLLYLFLPAGALAQQQRCAPLDLVLAQPP